MDHNDVKIRAALVRFHHDGIVSHRQIFFGLDPRTLIREVAEHAAIYLSMLVDGYVEHVNVAELDVIYESWFDGPCPEDWSASEVCEFIRKLPEHAIEEYERTNSAEILGSHWYETGVSFLNDIFPDGSGLWVELEGPINLFLSQLVEFEVEEIETISQLTDARANWLGTLLILSRLNWAGDVPREQLHKLHDVVTEFNSNNAD